MSGIKDRAAHGRLSSTRYIALGFFLLIMLGAALLCLPCAAKSGAATPFADALFTSASATCVTGLIQYDTVTYWSLFGQIVILLLIQTGGLGFMTVLTLLSMFLKRKIGLRERKLLMESAGTMRISGVVFLTKRIFKGTFIFEGAGAVLLALRFVPELGLWRGGFHAIFTSVSAFCNAGFDLMGESGKFSSLTTIAADPLINFTVMALIVLGGLGFLVWSDVISCRFKWKALTLHSRVVLAATALLIAVPAVIFFFSEKNAAMSEMPGGERALASLFASVSPRTAGFNTVDLAQLSEGGALLTMVLMFIGGSPGSTAGGIKTTTVAVLLAGVAAAARRRTDTVISKRRIEDELVHRSCAILCIYLAAMLIGVLALLIAYPEFTLKEAAFEVVSAIGTVGLTLGITQELGLFGKLIIILFMYGGRIGGLTLALALSRSRREAPVKRPRDKLLVG